MFKKILIGTVLSAVVVVLLLQIDDELNLEIAAFLELAKPAEQSEAYLYLLGIVAAEDEDPLTVGKQIFASIQQAEERYEFGEEAFDFENYPEDKELALPEGNLFCSNSEENCWQTIFDDKQRGDQALKTHAILAQRYQVFINMTNYHTLSKPLVMEIFPPFHYLLKANRLVTLRAVNKQNTFDNAQAVAILENNIAAVRHHLVSADNLISKMIFTAMISENLDALSLLAHHDLDGLDINIALLSLGERDLSRAMSREFAMNHHLYTNLYKNPKIFALAGEEVSASIPGWLVQTFYKPNMSINGVYDFFKGIGARSRLEQSEFVAMALDKDRSMRSTMSYIRNSVGNTLTDVASPNFDQYIARLFDLNAKIAIFNQTTKKAELPVVLNYIQNPYYETGDTAYYSKDGKSICLTGPLDDDNNLRCLRVKP